MMLDGLNAKGRRDMGLAGVDESERNDLTDTLIALTGNDFEIGEVAKSASLPLTEPAPNLDFDGKIFCFTGTFTFGTRKACEAAVARYGAICLIADRILQFMPSFAPNLRLAFLLQLFGAQTVS